MAPQQADHFLIPLLDGSHALGQVIATPDATLHKKLFPAGLAWCLLTNRRGNRESNPPVTPSEILALRFIALADIGTDLWPIAGFEQIPRSHDLDDVLGRLVGDVPTADDPAVIEAFLNACHGLYPWDGFGERDFFDRMLRDGVARPSAARITP